jgi:hypothetical protein
MTRVRQYLFDVSRGNRLSRNEEARGAQVIYNRSIPLLPCRGVAQPGSAPALGAGGLEFKSPRPDH